MDKIYLCIDLKSFFASCECANKGLDPFKVNLVVADPARGSGAICLAITPAMKEKGIKNRCRIFEIPEGVSYLIAMPRMNLYIDYSSKIYAIYLRYVSSDDIHVYSIDECFLDVTSYLKLYKLTARELAKKLMDEIYNELGIRATAGIGTNLFLAKVALDVMAKHALDFIGFLDEETFKKDIWYHKPITDIWNVGKGIAKRLEKYDVYDLHGISVLDEKILYKEFGVNALFLIDHSKGIEPCTIKDIHNYHTKSNSISNSQILFEDYNYDDALLVLKEMVDINVLTLVEKELVCNCISIFIGFSKDVINRIGVSLTLNEYTNSQKTLNEYFIKLYKNSVPRGFPIRNIGISFNNVVSEIYLTYNLFSDIEFLKKEKKMQQTIIEIKKKYGKNSILKVMDLKEKATSKKRNTLVGGHNG